MSPFFSVCIPAFNAGKYLSATIDSVLAQTFTDFEIVVLDNASTDNTKTVISSYDDSRIRVETNSVTVPAHENWTRAVRLARGEWVKLLCADDLLKPKALQNINADLLMHKDALVHVGIRDVIDQSGKLVKSAKEQFGNGSLLNLDDVVNRVLSSGTNPLGESMCLTWKKSLTEIVGPFSGHWKYFIDLDYWLRLSRLSKIYYTTEVIGSFRVSPSSWTKSIGFGSIREAREFFLGHEDFKVRARFLRYRALVQATLRTVARQGFLALALRKDQ